MRLYSVIVPVYNRPQEVLELLESLVKQTYTNFEVIIVEDGSDLDCKEIVESFNSKLDITYFFKDNSGQGFSRNFGFDKAKGDYFIVFDSDCLIPENYFETVEKSLEEHYLDAYGGPDREHESFTNTQKAISYSMTSLFTTGGIRGRKGHVGQFHPRSFNMGISREVYEKTDGYIITRMGEDIEFSIRILENGFKVGLISDAFVYHKRRTNLAQFYKQLHFFGRARINIGRFFKNEIKVVHLFPAAFLIGLILTILGTIMFPKIFVWFAGLFGVYFSLIAIDSLLKNKNLAVAIISLAAALIQLSAYGIGFITEGLKFKRSK